MTAQQLHSTRPLRDALHELVLATQALPSPELLDEFVRRYPEHATALTDFAVELTLDTFAEASDEEAAERLPSSVSPAVAKAMSRFHNRLYAVKAESSTVRAAPPTLVAENPFTALDRAQLRSLGQRLNANTVFVMKLRDRQILAETIPEGFQRRIAEELKAPMELVAAHFAAQAQIEPRMHFKADQKPEVGAKQTFPEAVRSSGLTPEQQDHLLRL